MDRRTVIADAAITVIADAGLRALTHRSLDTALNLPSGSTSYYFRTRRDLLSAVVERIANSSRATFEQIAGGPADDPAEATVRYLRHLLGEREAQLRARHALLLDPGMDEIERTRLGTCLFSVERAADLFDDPAVADGYVALCEGLVVAGLSRADFPFERSIVTYLKGAVSS
ncbi:MAG: hypothetical protein WBQ44_12500 [Rhodococcus sp. (in: high G+C Gram-positive bacteria)]